MPAVVGHHRLRLVPAYRVISLQDSRHSGLDGSAEALAEANRAGAAVAPSGLYLSVNQDQLPVDVDLVILDGPPPHDPDQAAGWTRTGTFTMPFPSGDVALGDLGGRAINGPWLRHHTGDYTVDVWCRGREQAAIRQVEMFSETADLTIPESTAYIHREGAGIEQYQLRLWPMDQQAGVSVPPDRA